MNPPETHFLNPSSVLLLCPPSFPPFESLTLLTTPQLSPLSVLHHGKRTLPPILPPSFIFSIFFMSNPHAKSLASAAVLIFLRCVLPLCGTSFFRRSVVPPRLPAASLFSGLTTPVVCRRFSAHDRLYTGSRWCSFWHHPGSLISF